MSTCVNLLTDQLGSCGGTLHIGRNSHASSSATVIGVRAYAEMNSTVIGYKAMATYDAVAIGTNAGSCYPNSVIIGTNGKNYGQASTVIGINAHNFGNRNVVIASGIETCLCGSVIVSKDNVIVLAAGMCSADNPKVKFEMGANGCGCYLEFRFGGTTKRISARDFFTKLGM